MSQIKAVIFDMDGVLIEAKDWHYEALNRALRLFGLEISYLEHLTTFDGLPTKKKLEILSVDRKLPKSLHNFIKGVEFHINNGGSRNIYNYDLQDSDAIIQYALFGILMY